MPSRRAGIFSVSINSAPTAPSITNKTIKSAVAWSFTVPAFTDANQERGQVQL